MPDLFSYQRMSSAPLTLSQLTSKISNAVHTTPGLSGVRVIAELSDVRVNGGHCYMELVEKDGRGQTVAKLRANIWANVFVRIRRNFYTATGRDIQTGMKVLLQGNTTHHSLYGLAFNITDIDPSYTLGDIERIRREILERLEREGILDLNRNLPMATPPQRIAVISAAGAAGYGDFVNQLNSNSRGFVFYSYLFPAVMQGDKVAGSVAAALNLVESTREYWDCVAIIRGGGATTDLIGFDNYELARRVAEFPLPIVVGIGHERDRTVLDEIAHTRVKTPTAAAAFFIESAEEAYSSCLSNVEFITRYATQMINGEQRRLSQLSATLPAVAKNLITQAESKYSQTIVRLPAIVESRIMKDRMYLDSLVHKMQGLLTLKFELEGRKHTSIAETIRLTVPVAISNIRNRLEKMEALVGALNPEQTLKRGYSIVRFNGKAVTSGLNLKKGDSIEIQMQKGSIDAIVENLKEVNK